MIKILALCLCVTTLLTYLSHRFTRLPPTIGIMATALVFSLAVQGLTLAGYPIAEEHSLAVLQQVDFESVVMTWFLPFLLFAGALHVNVHDLRAYRWPIGSLATVGVVASTFAIGSLTYLLLPMFGWQIDFLYCLMLGALLSPTDPIAVLGLLRTAGAPKPLRSVITGEALLNDGTGVVVFGVLLSIAHLGSTPTVSGVTMLFIHEAGGGALLGLILGGATLALMRTIDQFHVEVMLSLSLVTGGAVLASALHVSAPIAMVTAGLMIGNMGLNHGMSPTTRKYFQAWWELIDEILNAALFALIGLELLLLPFSFLHVVAGVMLGAVVLIARWVTVAPAAFFKQIVSGRRTIPRGSIRILTWGGLRGGVSVALALSLPAGSERDLLLSLTYIVVLGSILIQGLTIGPLVAMIYGKSESNASASAADPALDH